MIDIIVYKCKSFIATNTIWILLNARQWERLFDKSNWYARSTKSKSKYRSIRYFQLDDSNSTDNSQMLRISNVLPLHLSKRAKPKSASHTSCYAHAVRYEIAELLIDW